MVFAGIIQYFQQVGLFDFVLPFLLFLALIYGLLQASKVISEQVSVNGVISIAIALFIVVLTPISQWLPQIFFTLATLLLVALLFLVTAAMFGLKVGGIQLKAKELAGPFGIIAGAAAGIIVAIFGIVKFNLELNINTAVILAMLGIIAAAVITTSRAGAGQ